MNTKVPEISSGKATYNTAPTAAWTMAQSGAKTQQKKDKVSDQKTASSGAPQGGHKHIWSDAPIDASNQPPRKLHTENKVIAGRNCKITWYAHHDRNPNKSYAHYSIDGKYPIGENVKVVGFKNDIPIVAGMKGQYATFDANNLTTIPCDKSGNPL